MKIKTIKEAQAAHSELKRFYRDYINRAVKESGNPTELARRIGKNKESVRVAIKGDSFVSLHNLAMRVHKCRDE